MPRLCRCLWAAIALVLFVLSTNGTPALAAEPGSLIVIVDGSGSMWGPIEGVRQTKLVLAREALRRGLGKMAPQARVGLALFGHRRGDCSDVEVVRPPEPLDVPNLMSPLEQFNPRGRGPLTLALREAAKSLPRDAGPRTLLLIHDDADNCQPDLCAAAAELKTAGITAHVVGLNVKTEDMAKMVCLPQTTGGRHFNAQNAEQVAAYVEEALLLTASEMGGIETRPTSPQGTAIVPPSPLPASGPPALHLRALAAANTEPLAIPLEWTVTAEARPDVPIFGARAANPTVPVSPGRYVVEVRDGPLSVKQAAEVRDNRPATVTMVLNAGMARIRVPTRKTGEVLADALITVTDANGALMLASRTGETTALLPAGRHVVRAELGLVRAEQTVTIIAGRLIAVDMSLNAARLQLTTAGGLQAPVFSVFEDDPDAPGGRREVARSAAQPAEFVLPPGTYYVVARQGAVEARERLAVGPGDVVRRTLAVAAGSLALSTKLPALGGGADAYTSYTVTRLDNTAQEAVTTSRPTPTLLLPSGRYRVEGRYGLMNVKAVRDIEIKSGQTQQLVIEHEAAAVRLRIVGSGPTDVSWVIRDQTGKAVWTGAHTEAVANLQAGRYLIGAETRNKRDERSVELRSGEAKLLEFSVD
ncbi:MAG TPA: VWA domain-containing protein [Hyphomicrobiaceae bacterium]|nr:VWA domain-containing protein [Hyphomicrobiaceae bacterium]